MNKIIYSLFIFYSFIAFSSCIDDEGNYVYKDLIRVGVDSLEASYQVRTMVDHLVIKPEVTSNGDYECMWMMYSTKTQVNPDIDTISYDKELNYLVTEPAGDYRLVLRVTDQATGDAVYTTAEVNVATIYSNGWYVLKDVGGQTDIDLITPEREKVENLFLNLLGNYMPGNPMDISYTPAYTYIDEESVKHMNEPILWVCSGEEVYMLKVADLSLVYKHDELFYGEVLPETPYHVCYGPGKSYFVYMSSAGIYYYHGMTPSSGKFGSPIRMDDGYELGVQSYNMNRSTMFWDNLNSRFIALNNGSLRPFQDKNEKGEVQEIVPNNMNCDLLLLDRTSSAGYAVLKDRTTGELLIVELDPNTHDSFSPLFYNPINNKNAIRVPASSGMASATVFAQNHKLAYLYYSDGLQVNMIDFMTNTSREDIAPLEPGETVSYMKHLYWNPSVGSDKDKFEYLVIGTTQGDNYTLSFYELLGGVPDKSKEIIRVSGTGKIKDVQFLSSQMSMFTNFNEYPLD